MYSSLRDLLIISLALPNLGAMSFKVRSRYCTMLYQLMFGSCAADIQAWVLDRGGRLTTCYWSYWAIEPHQMQMVHLPGSASDSQVSTIVCGCSSVVGKVVPVALPGTQLQGTH